MKQVKASLITFAAVGSVALIVVGAASGAIRQARNAFNTKPTGSITPWAAMNIAAKKSGGRAFQAIYEFDEGKWSYAVMVVKNRKLYEVEIDPESGKVGDVEEASIDGEAKEMKSDFATAVKEAGAHSSP